MAADPFSAKSRHTLLRYLTTLVECLDATHRANDRPLYKAFIVDAARMLAVLESKPTHDRLMEAVHGHERLWGYTWLSGPEREQAERAWQDVRTEFQEPAA